MALNKAFDLLFLAKQDGLEIILNNDQLQLKYPKQRKVDKNLIEEIRNSYEYFLYYLSFLLKTDVTLHQIPRSYR